MQARKDTTNKVDRIKLKKVDTVIIGAGPSGLSAATTLTKQGKDVLLIEKESRIGGKCYTFSDPENTQNKTEWGAVAMAANYGKILDQIKEKKVSLEPLLHSDASTIPLVQKFNKMSLCEQTSFVLAFTQQMAIFAQHAKEYQRLRDAHQDLPDDYKCSFTEFAKKYHLELIKEFSYVLVPAFGYGLLETCPTYVVLQYYGMTTVPEVALGGVFLKDYLLLIKDGIQGLMEKIACGLNIKLNSAVESIDRHQHGVEVNFKSNEGFFTVAADHLILANSPLHWKELGMKLTYVEQQCVEQLSYYQYPVAIVKLKNYPAQHYYEYKNLNEAGLGHLAFIATRDNRQNPEDGRLCTVYINLKESKNNPIHESTHFEFTPDKIKQLEDELLQVPGVTGVNILATRVWQDYLSTLPWECRLALDRKQMSSDTHTLYVGSYTLGGFENVSCVWEQADKIVSERLLNKKSSYDAAYYFNELNRAIFFFTSPKAKPFNGLVEVKPASGMQFK